MPQTYYDRRTYKVVTIKARPLAEILATRDVSESITICAENLARLVKRTERHLSDSRLGNRLEYSLPKIYLLEAADQEAHRDVIKQALCLISSGKTVPKRRALAARLMLAEFNQDTGVISDISAEHAKVIKNARSRVSYLIENARISIGPSAGNPLLPDYTLEGYIYKKNHTYPSVLELKKVLDALYLLGISGIDLPMARFSLQLISSDFGEDHNRGMKHDIRMITAEVMLARLERQ